MYSRQGCAVFAVQSNSLRKPHASRGRLTGQGSSSPNCASDRIDRLRARPGDCGLQDRESTSLLKKSLVVWWLADATITGYGLTDSGT